MADETKTITAMAALPKDAPVMLAWEAYKSSPEYANTRRWALHEEHVDGSLWAAFLQAWNHRIEPEAADRGASEAELEPFKFYDGDIPDCDSRLHPVFVSGVEYAVRLLANILNVQDYEQCDGTEEFDGDLGGTMMNIVSQTWPKDEHGDWIDQRPAIQSLRSEQEGGHGPFKC